MNLYSLHVGDVVTGGKKKKKKLKDFEMKIIENFDTQIVVKHYIYFQLLKFNLDYNLNPIII